MAKDTTKSLNALNGFHGKNLTTTYEPIVHIAQNKKKKASNGVIVHGVEKTDENATKPKPIIKDKNAPKKTKQIKPFDPSETIPADQEVDFPYDI